MAAPSHQGGGSLPNMPPSSLAATDDEDDEAYEYLPQAANVYPLHLLLTSNYRLPGDVDRCNLERHLTDAEFEVVFKCLRDEFYRLPYWKRCDLKRRSFLFWTFMPLKTKNFSWKTNENQYYVTNFIVLFISIFWGSAVVAFHFLGSAVAHSQNLGISCWLISRFWRSAVAHFQILGISCSWFPSFGDQLIPKRWKATVADPQKMEINKTIKFVT